MSRTYSRAHIAARYSAGMECCWVALALLSADAMLPHPHGLLLGLALMLFYPAANYACLLARRITSKELWQWAICIALLIGIWIYLAVGPLPGGDGVAIEGTDYRRFFAGMAVAALWFRGWMLPERELEPADVAQGFNVGLVGLIPAMLLKAAGAPFILLTMAFVALALIAHRQAKAGTQQEPEAASRRGMVAIVVAIACVLAAGMALALLMDPSWVGSLTELPKWIVDHLADLLGVNTEEVVEGDGDNSPVGSSRRRDQGLVEWTQLGWVKWIFEFFEGKEALLGTLVFGLLLAILIFVGWIWWTRRQARLRASTAGLQFEHSSMGFAALIRELARWLQALLLGWLLAPWRLVMALVHRLMPSRESGTVRHIYQQALAYLARRGWPRAPHESPEEYARRLLSAWLAAPGQHAGQTSGEEAFATLTTAFVADCYGPQRLEARKAGLDWGRLRKDLKVVKPKSRRKAKPDSSTDNTKDGRSR